MKNNKVLVTVLTACVSLAVAGCGGNADTTAANTTEAATTEAQTTVEAETEMETTTAAAITIVEETAAADVDRFEWETIAEDEIDSEIYEMTGGTWFYTGVEDEKSIDMDGLKGLTTYTAEAIPEAEGYLRYLGNNPDGLHVFDVYDLYGRYYMTMTFVSEDQFYIDSDETNYYVKWDY